MCRAGHPYALGTDPAGRSENGEGALLRWQQLLQPLQRGGVGWGDRPSDSPNGERARYIAGHRTGNGMAAAPVRSGGALAGDAPVLRGAETSSLGCWQS